MSSKPQYTLHYHPSIPGRGEYVRLAFEAAGVAYEDKHDAMEVSMTTQHGVGHPPAFAVPFLEVHNAPLLNDEESQGSATATKAPHTDSADANDKAASDKRTAPGNAASSSVWISQTPAILAYLASALGLDGVSKSAGSSAQGAAELRRAQVSALTNTVLDLSNETHDVHHPIAASLYYEDQREESKRRAENFRSERLLKFFKYFNLAIESNPAQSGFLIGQSVTTADLCLFQVIEGLLFAFPKRMQTIESSGHYRGVFALRERVAEQPGVAKYLKSGRRAKFSMGMFRHYPELDAE